MTEKNSVLPGIILFIAIFVAILSAELIAFMAASKFSHHDFFAGLNSLPAVISAALAAWVFALVPYLFFFASRANTDAKSMQERPNDLIGSTPASNSSPIGDAAYKNTILALIALASANGKIDTEKVNWIEALHDEFIERFPELTKIQINKAALHRIANTASLHGPHQIINALENARNNMDMKEKASLIRFCLFISAYNGSVSEIEANIILDIAATIGFPKARIFEL